MPNMKDIGFNDRISSIRVHFYRPVRHVFQVYADKMHAQDLAVGADGRFRVVTMEAISKR